MTGRLEETHTTEQYPVWYYMCCAGYWLAGDTGRQRFFFFDNRTCRRDVP